LKINNLPNELLLEIFDFYRRGIHPYDCLWKKKYVWINITHVCGKWRAVMFASSSRLELGIIVGPDKPSDIKTILSGPLPILIDYVFKDKYVTKSAFWRLGAALGHPHRVREISFEGTDGLFEQFSKATNCFFPVLESLSLRFGCRYGRGSSPKLPDTFLKGPDLSDLHLRRLELKHVTLKSISGFLSSAKTLTNLILEIDLGENPSAQMRFLVCFQSMRCLRRLDLSTRLYIGIQFLPTPSAPKRIVPLSKLTFFRFVGHIQLLDALVARLSAPSLKDVDISFSGANSTIGTIVHLPRFINGIKKRYHAVHLDLRVWSFNLSLLTQSEHINHCKPRFKLYQSSRNSDQSFCSSLMQLSDALSTKLTDVGDLRVTIVEVAANPWEDNILWRRFLRQFPNVKALRIAGLKSAQIARIFIRDYTEPDDYLPFLPALEEIELPKLPALTHETRSQLSKCTAELALFEPFVSARKRTGRPVNVFFGH
jgi:hypothetical protein